MNEVTVPLVVLAAELNVGVDKLADQLGDDVLVDGTGIRVVERRIASVLLDQHSAQQAEKQRRDAERAQRRAARHAEMAEQSQAFHDRLRAQAEAQRELIAANPEAPALAVMTAAEDHARKDAAGARWDAYVRAERTGEMEYVSISPPREER